MHHLSVGPNVERRGRWERKENIETKCFLWEIAHGDELLKERVKW